MYKHGNAPFIAKSPEHALSSALSFTPRHLRDEKFRLRQVLQSLSLPFLTDTKPTLYANFRKRITCVRQGRPV